MKKRNQNNEKTKNKLKETNKNKYVYNYFFLKNIYLKTFFNPNLGRGILILSPPSPLLVFPSVTQKW